MTSFYRHKLMANQEIDQQLKNAKKNGTPLSKSFLVLNITSRFEVPEKLVLKRIELHCEADKNIKMYGDEIVFAEADL